MITHIFFSSNNIKCQYPEEKQRDVEVPEDVLLESKEVQKDVLVQEEQEDIKLKNYLANSV
jgi:hypothetical protein